MAGFSELLWGLLRAAIWIGAIYWANLVFREIQVRYGLRLSSFARLFLILSLATLVSSPISYATFGILGVVGSGSATYKAGGFIGGAAMAAFVAWLFTRPDWRD